MATEEPPPEWLPLGWTMEVSTRLGGSSAGRRDKVCLTSRHFFRLLPPHTLLGRKSCRFCKVVFSPRSFASHSKAEYSLLGWWYVHLLSYVLPDCCCLWCGYQCNWSVYSVFSLTYIDSAEESNDHDPESLLFMGCLLLFYIRTQWYHFFQWHCKISLPLEVVFIISYSMVMSSRLLLLLLSILHLLVHIEQF